MFNERSGTPFNATQFPTDIILMVVLWRIRYKLGLRDLVEMFAVRGYDFSHETVRDWEARFTPLLTAQLRAKRRGQAGKSWYVDETYVKVRGHWCYLYRAIDRDGNLVDTMLSQTRDLAAAKSFFKQAMTTVGCRPERVTTDKHASYRRAISGIVSRLRSQLERDLIRSRDWDYSVTAFSVEPKKREAMRNQVLHEYGANYELILPTGAPLKTPRKNKRPHSRATQRKREIAASAQREYNTDDVLQAAQNVCVTRTKSG